MRYFFILGTNPTLSLAELAAVFNHGQFSLIQKNIAILDINQNLEDKLIKKIGGTIKFGIIHNETASLDPEDILKLVATFSKPEKSQSKFNFGISHYGKAKVNIKILAMEFKKLLKESGINSRWVISREPTLSSVVVEQNKLVTDKGVEIVMIEFNKKLLFGRTIAVQPFKELSFRDYGRPARDDRSGMLPPKLAQIMINLALAPSPYQGEGRGEVTILDPFCGSGTIITEAMLMGYQNIIGSDISNRAISDTKKNVEWIKNNFDPPAGRAGLRVASCELRVIDATQISKHLAPNSIDAIITEPYLGPQNSGFDTAKIIKELEQLYSKSLMEFKKILKPSGRIIIIWPVFQGSPLSLRATRGSEAISRIPISRNTLNPSLNGFTIINPIPKNLRKNIFLKLTARNTMVYGREEQKVWREIVMLEKEN